MHSGGLDQLGDTASSYRNALGPTSTPFASDWEIPNANFARKFGLYTNSGPLPSSIKELPVAEDKAIGICATPAPRGHVHSRSFQGPFTPQLWFDSGLDYRWKRDMI